MAVTLGIMALVFGIAKSTPTARAMSWPSRGFGSDRALAANLFVVAFGTTWHRSSGFSSARCSRTRSARGVPRWRPAQWVANWLITVSFPGS